MPVSFILRAFLLIAALLAGQAAHAERVILVFGDSLSAGYGLPAGTGWVSLLEQRLEQTRSPYRVVNASVSGETTLGGRNRIEQTLSTHRPAIVILELGANDGLRGQSLDDIGENLTAIVQACERRRASVLLVGMRLPPNYGIAYTQKFQDLFRNVAKRNRARLVPFLLEGFADRRELFQSDGVHPIAEAQPRMLDTVWKELRPMLRNL